MKEVAPAPLTSMSLAVIHMPIFAWPSVVLDHMWYLMDDSGFKTSALMAPAHMPATSTCRPADVCDDDSRSRRSNISSSGKYIPEDSARCMML